MSGEHYSPEPDLNKVLKPDQKTFVDAEIREGVTETSSLDPEVYESLDDDQRRLLRRLYRRETGEE
ncbi:hypothetical protein HY218_00950 [Candidatus Saccharibacteria bacterium]|nr:hypothetical protein [Candidatus Saccharibacteria bacterium]